MMKKRPLVAVILAAGKGTRMKSDLPKVLHPINNKPMLLYVIDLAKSLKAVRIICVLGYQKNRVIEVIRGTGAEYVFQEEQLGTGHAVRQVEPLLNDFDGDIIVLSGDVPLLKRTTLEHLLARHIHQAAGATLLTALFDDPTGYGRIIRNTDDTLNCIVEHKDCTDVQLSIREINAGIYVFDAKIIFEALKKIDNNNQQGEYYLPDALDFFPDFGKSVALEITNDREEIIGVNTLAQLSEINRIFRVRNEQDN